MLMQPCKFDSGLEHFLITIYCLLSVSAQFLCNRNVKRPKRVQNNNSSNNNKQTNRNTDDREHWLKISMKISPVLSIARQNNTKNFMVILWLVQPQDKHKSVLEGVKSKHQLFTFMQHSKLGQRSVVSFSIRNILQFVQTSAFHTCKPLIHSITYSGLYK